ncbi:VOC family protein [Nocardia spumae]|uniref:VOC family protein n=1 Tax=Nocardia spumae TaxID=2887190 RepID=UPI001D13BE59|nr:VOC family protein [Nocardia spumae]
MAVDYGPITQIAWVGADIEATERLLSAQFGAGSWTRLPDTHFGPHSCRYRGEPADFTAHISLSYLADMQLELIQPVRGTSIYTEFLDRSGPGLHHVCFEPSDFDAAISEAAAGGLPVIQNGAVGDTMRYAYIDGAAAGVPYIEIAEIGPQMREFYRYVKDHAH